MDTQLVEIEDGMTENESITRSLRSCIEAAVLELIYQGEQNDFWEINWPDKIVEDKVEELVDEAPIILVEPDSGNDLPEEVITPENLIEEIRG